MPASYIGVIREGRNKEFEHAVNNRNSLSLRSLQLKNTITTVDQYIANPSAVKT